MRPARPVRTRLRALRYTAAFSGPLLAAWGLTGHGAACWAFPLYGFVLVPVLELLITARHVNLTDEEEQAALNDPLYDALLYLFVPVQWGMVVLFLGRVGETGLSPTDLIGRVVTMGMMCGIYGINVAHELGHRRNRWERDLARTLLLSALYMHFIIEHNRGHHARVATPDDPASARFNEPLYRFWARSIAHGLRSAWRIEADRLRKEGHAPFGPRNEMIRSLAIELALVVTIGAVWGGMALVCFLAAALLGILLLETVNYIEHYGLRRVRTGAGRYGRVRHVHSWNSDLLPGRLMLFELTRHSDHHYVASRKYQVLRSQAEGPQLPTGYPGMMLLSLVPPLWFRVMNPIVERMRSTHTAELDVAR